MNRKNKTFDQIIQNKLTTSEDQELYLSIAVEDYFETGDEKTLLLALRQVIIAQEGFTSLAEKTGLSRESLYRTLSGRGNPKLKTLQLILSALGYGLILKKKTCQEKQPA